MRKVNFFWESVMNMKNNEVMEFFQVDEYTRLEEEETLIENGTVFFANQLNFWGQTTLGVDC